MREPRASRLATMRMAMSLVPPSAPEPGLCAHCQCHRVVTSGRGSRFWLCGLAAVDARFVRYPRLPVLECRGFAAALDEPAGQQEAQDRDPEQGAAP